MLTPTGYLSPNTAADMAHSTNSTQPALPPHRATPRAEDKPLQTRRPHSNGLSQTDVLVRHIGPDSRRDWSHCPPGALGVDGVPVTIHGRVEDVRQRGREEVEDPAARLENITGVHRGLRW